MDKKKLLESLLKGFDDAKNYASPIWRQRIEEFKLLKGKSGKKKYKSEANFHVPYTETLLENVFPLLVARLPESNVAPRNSDRDEQASLLMDDLMDYTFDVERFDQKFMETTKEAMQLDTGWVEVCWKYENKDTDHPTIKNKDTFNILVHPRKEEIDDRWPTYELLEMTKSEMKKQNWDISGLTANKLEDDTYRNQRLQTLNFNVQDSGTGQGLFEVIKVWAKMDLSFGDEEDNYYGEDRMALIVIVNREKIVNINPLPGKKLFESPYDHNYCPLVPLPYNPDPRIIYGQSFIRPIADQQRELNALENMKVDNYKRRNSPPLLVNRNSNIDLANLRFENSVPWLVNKQDDIEPFELPDLATSIDNQQQMIRRTMQDRTGANDLLLVSTDVAVQGGDTATGASIANENTKLRFRPQAVYIDFFIKRIGELIIALYQQPDLFDKKKAISVADEEGNYFEKLIGPKDIKGDLQFKVRSASSLAESDEQKITKYANLKELYAQDQSINQEVFDKPLLEAAGIDYSKAKIGKDEGLNQLATKLTELTARVNQPDFKSLPPAIQNRVLAQIQKLKGILQSQAGEQDQSTTPESPLGSSPIPNGQPAATPTSIGG